VNHKHHHNHQFEESLVINVRRGPWRNQFTQPEDSPYLDKYSILKEGGRTIVLVYWERDEKLPKCLEFRANDPILGIGFAESGHDPKLHWQEGHCGGCFYLRQDISDTDTSAFVDNQGNRRKDGFISRSGSATGTRSAISIRKSTIRGRWVRREDSGAFPGACGGCSRAGFGGGRELRPGNLVGAAAAALACSQIQEGMTTSNRLTA
jgi:hypothetical protein